jgi:hypothetical protein
MKMSRPNRRAARRAAEKMKAYEIMCKVAGKSDPFTKPGIGKKW